MKFLPTSTLFKQAYFGIALHKDSLRAVSITDEKILRSQAEVALPPEIYSRGSLQQPFMIAAFKQLITIGGFPETYAAITIPDVYSFSRLQTLPKINLAEVSEAVEWQIEKIFPLPKTDIYFDWKLINETASELTILVVALRRILLDDLVSVTEAVGIKPISFEPASSALARVIPPPSSSSCILIELNRLGTATTLIQNQLSLITVTHEFDPQENSSLLTQKISQSVVEVKNFYLTHTPGSSKDLPIYLTGESTSPQLIAWLNQSFSPPVTILPLTGIPPAFHQAYAAASTAVFPPQSELSINLLPTKLQQLFDASLRKKQLITSLQICLTLLSGAVFFSVIIFIFALFKIQSANETITNLEASQSAFQLDTKKIALVNKASNSIVRLFPTKTTPVNSISQVFSLIPVDFHIINFSYSSDKNSLNLVGVAPNRSGLIALRDNLKATQKFTDVLLPIGSWEKPTNIEFTMTLILPPPIK